MTKIFGYVPSPEATEKFVSSLQYPTLDVAGPRLKSTRGDVLLYNALLKVCPTYSRVAQAIGSCVGHGFAGCVDILAAVEIAIHGEAEDWEGRCLEAYIYGASRVEARGQKTNNGGDGSYGAAAAKAVSEYGNLHYGVDYKGKTFDKYSGDREKEWGRSGVPDDLEPYAKKRRVKTTTLVESFDGLVKSISNGYPVAICSNQGFTMTRGDGGWAKPYSQWAHCMAAISLRDIGGKRPGALIWNSWGPRAHSGPQYPDNMPEAFKGSTFWADAEVVDRMLSRGDSFALSSYDGFPPRKLPDWTGGIL